MNAQPISERAVYFSFRERGTATYSGKWCFYFCYNHFNCPLSEASYDNPLVTGKKTLSKQVVRKFMKNGLVSKVISCHKIF